MRLQVEKGFEKNVGMIVLHLSILLYCSLSVVSPKRRVIAKSDSGATSHYWKLEDSHILDHIQDHNGTLVASSDMSTLQSTQQGIIPLSSALTKTSTTANILPGLKSSSLLSLGKNL